MSACLGGPAWHRRSSAPTRNELRLIEPAGNSQLPKLTDGEFDDAMLRTMRSLVDPFADLPSTIDAAGDLDAQRRYWSQPLPDGRTAQEFVLAELEWANSQLRATSGREEIQRLIDSLHPPDLVPMP